PFLVPRASGRVLWRRGLLAARNESAMLPEPVLRVEDLHLRFHGIQAIAGVEFVLAPREILGIIGPNGAGKTSVLNCINGFYRPQRGRIVFGDGDITHLPPHRDRKSTRLNSSHGSISYAVFCLNRKK